jgi:hypothetical protein
MTEREREIVDWIRSTGHTVTQAARHFDTSRSMVYKAMSASESAGDYQPPPRDPDTWSEKGDIASLCFTTKERIRTIADALEYAEVDTAEWEVVEHSITSHETPMKIDDTPAVVRAWNVKAKFRRRAPRDPLRVKTEVMEFLKGFSPKPKAIRLHKVRNGMMLLLSIPDIHIGKLSDAWETGDDYNIEIARKLYLDAVRHMLERAQAFAPIARIVIVIGNDMMHFDGSRYSTTKGTPQVPSGIWQRVFRVTWETAVEAIEMCRQVAPTEVQCHPDNHAGDASFYIGDVLWAYYRNTDGVTVDNAPREYKMVRHGDVLIMLGHGDKAKYPNLVGEMARLWPRDFAECSFKEIHLGHLHSKQLEDDFHSVWCRRNPSLSGTDSWHAGMGYSGRKAAQCFVYDEVAVQTTLFYHPPKEAYVA